MKRIKKNLSHPPLMKLLLLSGFSIIISCLYGQSVSPFVFGCGGGVIEMNDKTLAWTFGELAIETSVATSYTLTQGFHQTIEEISLHNGTPLTPTQLAIYPNPTSGVLNLEIPITEKVHLQLVDINGKIVLQKRKENLHQIDLTDYPTGVYMALIESSNGHYYSFKVTKLNQ